MDVRFNKEQLVGSTWRSPGEVADLPADLAAYLIRERVAEEAAQSPAPPPSAPPIERAEARPRGETRKGRKS